MASGVSFMAFTVPVLVYIALIFCDRINLFVVILIASLFHTVHVLMFNLLFSSGNVAAAG